MSSAFRTISLPASLRTPARSSGIALTARWWRRLAGPLTRLALLLAQHGLARQLDPVLIVDGDDFHLHPIADLAHAVYALDVLVVELADVAQAVAARQDFNK